MESVVVLPLHTKVWVASVFPGVNGPPTTSIQGKMQLTVASHPGLTTVGSDLNSKVKAPVPSGAVEIIVPGEVVP